MAVSMLISYACNNGAFAKAEELIQGLPSSSIDKEERLAILYQQQKQYRMQKKYGSIVYATVLRLYRLL